jgi:hypothetical protein
MKNGQMSARTPNPPLLPPLATFSPHASPGRPARFPFPNAHLSFSRLSNNRSLYVLDARIFPFCGKSFISQKKSENRRFIAKARNSRV